MFDDSDNSIGYDGLHPNAWGEYLIANAFSQTLVDGFQLGSSALKVPPSTDSSVARGLTAPLNLKVFSSPQGVTATWDPGKLALIHHCEIFTN